MSDATPATPADSSMDIHEVLNYLPHRYPFLLIDRVLEVIPDERITALKNVSINEPFFPGHYPHHPVMPGVLVIEAMAQAAAILSFKTLGQLPDDEAIYYFVGIDNARFKKPVSAGDQLILDIQLTLNKRGIWKYTAVAKVAGTVVAEADLICSVKPSGFALPAVA